MLSSRYKTKAPWYVVLILIVSACPGGSSGGGGRDDADPIDPASDMPTDAILEPSTDLISDPATEPISDPVADLIEDANLDQGLDNAPIPDTPPDQLVNEGIIDESGMDASDTEDLAISETGDSSGFDADSLGYDGWGTPDEGTVCWIFGVTGENVVCELRLARVAGAILPTVALSFTLSYPSSVTFAGFYDEVCFGETCFDLPMVSPDGVVPANQTSTGHSMNCAPDTIVGMSGSANCVLLNISNPNSPVTDAWLAPDEVTVEGDSLFLEARFTLNETLASNEAALFVFENILGSDESAGSLETYVRYDGLILTE